MNVTSTSATLTRNDSEADVDRAQQAEMANSFLARHRAPPILLLPNVWDALSARLFVAAGFDARMWLLRICSISEFDPCHRSRKKPTTENLFTAIVCC